MKEECIFCKIVKKEAPAEIIYEDDKILGFMDLNPKAPVHFLLIPKRHIPTLLNLKVEDTFLIGHIITTGVEIAKKLSIAQSGFRIISNCNEDAGQTVFHIHFHFMGGRFFSWPPG